MRIKKRIKMEELKDKIDKIIKKFSNNNIYDYRRIGYDVVHLLHKIDVEKSISTQATDKSQDDDKQVIKYLSKCKLTDLYNYKMVINDIINSKTHSLKK